MTDEERERIIRRELYAVFERLSADRSPLDLIADLAILEDFVDDFGQARIADARAVGASWSEIAGRLGVSRQAAHKRFGGGGDRRRRTGPVFELRFVRDRNGKHD